VLKIVQFIFYLIFLITVSFEGEITFTSQTGTYYILDERHTLSCTENTTFEYVKYGIF
jgi:hypothetical protein